MIKSFRCKDTEALFNDLAIHRFQAIQNVARRKLEILAAAKRLEDLNIPPGYEPFGRDSLDRLHFC